MIQSFQMGAGTLKLGAAGAEDISAQVANCRVEWTENVTQGEVVDVLSGEQLDGTDTSNLTAQLVGNVIQDIAAAGMVDYTWTNAGDEVDFEFIPNTAAGRKVTGVIRLVPITLGGDAKTKPRSDFTWACIGHPALGNVA